MLNFNDVSIGCSLDLPELATHIPSESPTFIVQGVFAGGMGVCVHFMHPYTKKEFALKGIRPDLVDEQATTDRFLDELKVWVAASACNLIAEAVAVVRVNEFPCVMATWMPNGDLARSLIRLTNAKKLEALLRIVRALSWVNVNLGVVHRDLKPSNILLDQNDLAYVADWGLARPIGRALQGAINCTNNLVERPDRTQHGSFLGTVTYAAPEQIVGSTTIDHRADIYALGCMMFEFETGAPPFVGTTVQEIATQHLRVKPKKLGGWFTSTNFGLERIISKCLEKHPEDRYHDYKQLESELLPIAKAHGVLLKQCELGERYKRTVLGKGEKQQIDLLKSLPCENFARGGYIVVEKDDILPFLKEANDLMALGRYAEAERVYLPHVVLEVLYKRSNLWELPHDIAANYCLCLNELGRAQEAVKFFRLLEVVVSKPAVFYINYSMTLNLLDRHREAADICREGLKKYPNDIDIQGNLTIALTSAKEYEQALVSAFKRLKIRRDVHSIDEVANVLLEYATAIRYSDLPRAIEIAKMAGDFIKEGLLLNPNHHFLRLRWLLLRCLIQDTEAVNRIAPSLWLSESVPLDIRAVALIQMLENWADCGWGSDAGADSVLKFIKSHPGWVSIIPKLKEIELRTVARYKMMRERGMKGIKTVNPEIAELFLKKQSSGLFLDPILTAQLIDWLGNREEAINVLCAYLSEVPDDFNGVRLMAIIQCNDVNFLEALKYANSLVRLAPWRAESYDCLAFVAAKAGDVNLESQAKAKGDKVFAEEARLLEEIRLYLN